MKVKLERLTADRKRPRQAFADFLIEDVGLTIKGCKVIHTLDGHYCVYLPTAHKERISEEVRDKVPPVKYTIACFKESKHHKEFLSQAQECIKRYVSR